MVCVCGNVHQGGSARPPEGDNSASTPGQRHSTRGHLAPGFAEGGPARFKLFDSRPGFLFVSQRHKPQKDARRKNWEKNHWM